MKFSIFERPFNAKTEHKIDLANADARKSARTQCNFVSYYVVSCNPPMPNQPDQGVINVQVENSPTAYNVYVTTPDTARELDCQRASLSLQQLVAIAPLVTEEAHQGVLRDYLLYGLRQQMQHRRSLKSDSRWIHERLADPGRGRHAEVLRTVNSLSRGGTAISADRIERILSRIEKSVA